MEERVLVILGLLTATLVGALTARLLVRRRVAEVLGSGVPSPVRKQLSPTGPTLLYFYGPVCPSCNDQVKIVDELAEETNTRVLKFNATEQRQVADALGVVTIPTTAIVDSAGRVRHLNLGYHPKGRLAEQLVGG